MPFVNRIRLPLYLKTPQFPTEANRFRLSNGESKTLSVTIRKVYELQSDYMGEAMHQRLVIALNHDTVNIEGDKYIGGASVEGDYEITWPDFLDYPLGQASVKLQATPFNFTNDNCQTCETATQLALVDDNAGEIAEGATGSVIAYNNDTICCFPIIAEIVSFNTEYLVSATINEATGEIILTAKNPAITVGSIVMATYRVYCPDGNYDEADVYASINGSILACEQPTDIIVSLSAAPAPFTLNASWTAPASPPLYYEYLVTSGGITYGSGNSAAGDPQIFTPGVTGLPGSTTFTLSVRSVCSAGVYSPYTDIEFTTPSGEVTNCGKFTISCDDGTTDREAYDYSYMDCNGDIQNRTIVNLSTRELCMLVDDFNEPVYFETTGPVDYLYIEPC